MSSKTRWWEHERFDVADTFTFRLAYSLLVISPFIEFIASAWLGHRVASAIAYGLVIIWMVGIFAIMARRTHLDHRALWEDDER